MFFKPNKRTYILLCITLSLLFAGCEKSENISEPDPLTLIQDGSEYEGEALLYKKEILKKTRNGIYAFPFDSVYFLDYDYMYNENLKTKMYDLFFIIYELPMQGVITVSKDETYTLTDIKNFEKGDVFKRLTIYSCKIEGKTFDKTNQNSTKQTNSPLHLYEFDVKFTQYPYTLHFFSLNDEIREFSVGNEAKKLGYIWQRIEVEDLLDTCNALKEKHIKNIDGKESRNYKRR
ncbi:MAG: hypothetical protein ABUK01_07025 [Leptospirales bacterium]